LRRGKDALRERDTRLAFKGSPADDTKISNALRGETRRKGFIKGVFLWRGATGKIKNGRVNRPSEAAKHISYRKR